MVIESQPDPDQVDAEEGVSRLFSSVWPHCWDKAGTRYLATLNVDVSNKPATKKIHLTKDCREMEECYLGQVLGRKQTRDCGNGLNRGQVDILERVLIELKLQRNNMYKNDP